MIRIAIRLTIFLLFSLSFTVLCLAHCEIPCGIYDDAQRMEAISEHIATVEKSMDTIKRLSNEEGINYNQIVRWVQNKESHATKIQDIVFGYFMTQRIKPVDADNEIAERKYLMELEMLHRLANAAMKSKQSTDSIYVAQMRELLQSFGESYFGKEEMGAK